MIEVCVASLESALLAQRAGADRIELNQALELDGLTPSPGLVQRVVDQLRISVIAMARPRSGGFCYSEDEWETLLADAKWLLAAGVDGIAFGALDEQKAVDSDRCRQMRNIVGSGELVFHKAFDEVTDWQQSLERLIETGINRVMTSGLTPNALEGAETIGKLVEQAAGRIEILPAGRIGADNVLSIVNQTGCNQVHGSFSKSGDLVDEIGQVIHCLKVENIYRCE